MTDHMKCVAKRNSKLDKKAFVKRMTYCGWNKGEISAMWEYAERYCRGELTE